jgi:glutamate N-acetyltransferase/amino-acid N-acetyltransferase
MNSIFSPLPGGSLTSPQGFLAGAVSGGLKASGGPDLGLVFSPAQCQAAGLFTRNRIKAAPILLTRRHLARGKARAIVANAGCANACTGPQGLEDAQEMARLTAGKLGLEAEEVLVASTGVIGRRLPMEKIRKGIDEIGLSREGGHDFVRAIMTTDTFPKETALALETGGKRLVVAGCAKGAGMVHPNLATMLAFLTTDALVDGAFLKVALKRAADISFNMITVDGDTSPNDMVIILASGQAGNHPIVEGSPEASIFQEALEQVCIYLARSIARDGEGARHLLEVKVEGAVSLLQARKAARTIASSPLVKAMVYGADPNWGRIAAALGRSGARVEEGKLEIYLDSLCLFRGSPLAFASDEVRGILKRPEVPIRAVLNLGGASATAWGCDLTPDYVKINSEYTT